uniref:Myb-like domain-containing protein n=2 Tax=Hordeum vulgare subsp. vulgare TaxID=112509 RepID=A0A8I6Z6Z2_HORVV
MEPAEEVQIWAPILADPLDWPPSSATIPLPSQVEECFSYVYGVDGMEISKFAQEAEDDLGDLIVKEKWWRGLRGPRKRRIFPWGSGGMNFHRRKNNEHWTLDEVRKLVKGVKTYGVGRWTMVKSRYFSSSVRDPSHLKDKWRNLLKACGVPCTSIRKEKAQKTMFRPLDTELIEQIQGLAIDSASTSKIRKHRGEGTTS